MSPRPQCPQAELAVGWVLSALEPGDEDQFLAHLGDCHICREAVQQAEELFAVLAAGNPQPEPRPEVRDGLMARVAATPQTPTEEREGAWPQPSGLPEGRSITVGWHATDDPKAGERALERMAQGRRFTRKRRIILLVATAVIAVVGLGGLVYRQVDDSHQRHQIEASSPGQRSHILGEVARPGARYAVLSSPGGEPVAGVMVNGGEREVYPYALVPNNKSTIYVLWGIGDGGPVPLGGFDVASSDNALRPVGPSIQGSDPYGTYAISIEQGRTLPTSPNLGVASGKVAS